MNTAPTIIESEKTDSMTMFVQTASFVLGGFGWEDLYVERSYYGLVTLGVMRFSAVRSVLSLRGRWLAVMNLALFSCVFVVALASEFLLPGSLYYFTNPNFFQTLYCGNFALIVLSIFLNNLVLSSFVLVTLPGLAFFPLSTGLLVYKGVIWGVLLHYQPTTVFLAALPTLVLEGEAYALAAVAGTVTGASWLLPKKVYHDEDITRGEAFRKALRESLGIYVVVVVLLFVAAVVETTTLMILR